MNRTLAALLIGLAAAAVQAQSSVDALRKAVAAIADVKAQTAPDSRQCIFEIKAYNDNNGCLVAGGITSDSTARNAVVKALAAAGCDYADSIKVLPYDEMALTCLSVASHRTAPKHSAELATQSLMGTPLRVLQKSAEWWRVQTPDGYIAYVPASSVAGKTPEEMDAWRRNSRFIVTAPGETKAYSTPTGTNPRETVADLTQGCIATAVDGLPRISGGRLHIELPDGRSCYADASAFTPIEEWAGQSFDADRILDTAYALTGLPYLWGGTSPKAIDCSGLTKTAYLANGLIIMRDASQQALTGKRIDASKWRTCRPGDLLFFGNASTGKVTHVGIYDNDGCYVHASGMVKRNSLDPGSPDCLPATLLHAVRIQGSEETPGITRVRNHPWYF